MSGETWDMDNEALDAFIERRVRERIAALEAPATFRYTRAPWLNIVYTCSGSKCPDGSIMGDGMGGFICSACKTRWSPDNAHNSYDGELLADYSDDDISNLPAKER